MSQTILIIEDDEASRMMYNEILSMEDFNVVEAEDGHAALSYLENNPNTANIPYIFISGQGEIREKAEELDALTYLKKPFDLDDFVNLVRTTLH
jgi:DNA-binding response OmpR family regulator